MKKFSDRQGEIIGAALGLIGDGGIQSLTIKNISHAVGVSEPALYRHFTNKHEILQSIIEYYDDENQKALKSIEDSEMNPLAQLESFHRRLVTQFAGNPALSITLLFNEVFQNDRKLMHRISKIMTRTQARITRIIEEGQGKGLIRRDISARFLSTVLIGVVRLTITRWRLANFGFDLEKEGSGLWEELERLLKP